METKCHATVKQFLHSNKLELQLIPPNMQQTNESEQSNGTFKDHLIAGLATVPP